MRRMIAAAVVMTGWAAGAAAQVLPDGKEWIYDSYNAQDVMRPCASCHGEYGSGGGGGVYPRLAGMHAEYLADQLRKFKTRERENIPMIPFVEDRDLSERDILDVSRWLSEQQLATRPPPPEVEMDAYKRLLAAKQTVQIPREAGDAQKGKAIYDSDCASCHGKQGQGRVKKPPLAGQHIPYLRAQIELFMTGKRQHDDIDQVIRPRKPEEWQDVWAYLSILDD